MLCWPKLVSITTVAIILNGAQGVRKKKNYRECTLAIIDLNESSIIKSILEETLLLFSWAVMSDSLQPYNPKNCSTPGFPILHYPSEFVQTHIH